MRLERQRGGFENQRGGFALGLIVGLLSGLALALGVALYIAKVPSPFHDKVPHRTPEQEAAEAEKLKSWEVSQLPTSPVVDRDPAYANIDKDGKKDDGPGWWSKLTDWWRK